MTLSSLCNQPSIHCPTIPALFRVTQPIVPTLIFPSPAANVMLPIQGHTSQITSTHRQVGHILLYAHASYMHIQLLVIHVYSCDDITNSQPALIRSSHLIYVLLIYYFSLQKACELTAWQQIHNPEEIGICCTTPRHDGLADVAVSRRYSPLMSESVLERFF